MAQPLRFFDATGRRAAVFGKQTGSLEAWIYPMKLLHGFRLDFRQEGIVEAVRGESLLQQVITRPESVTLIYVHPGFTVRQIIWVPRDEPAIAMLFDVDTDKPLALTVKFVPDFKPMWPASLGGQHSYWLAEDKAFALTDGTEHPTALVGSPAVAAFTDFVDHQLISGEMLLQLRVTPEQARTMLFPLVMALDMESEAKASAVYRDVLARARELYEERVRYYRDFLARTMTLETPDAELNRAFTWAKVAIDAGWVCHPKYGCGLVAGYGPSGDGERPGFDWWFGGDALMATWALEDYGDLPGALQALRFLKARQRADGKMMHEMTQSVDLVDWFGKYGFAYYHADTTPMYIYSVGGYFNRTGDKKFLEEFWDSVKKAYTYCLTTVDPADGLMDNSKAGLAAVEVGPLRGKVVKDIYLEGFWAAALLRLWLLASAAGDQQLSIDARDRYWKARGVLQAQWWNPQARYFAFGLTREGQRADMVGDWSAVLLGLAGVDQERGLDEATWLADPQLATDWGIRWLSNNDPLYDLVSYNNGSVWPFMSGFVAQAQYNYGASLGGFSTWSSTARLTGLMSPGTMPELMNGDRFLPGERAVPHQLFSSVGVILPAVHGLLGLGFGLVPVDGASFPGLSFVPRLPANWALVRFSHYFTNGVEFGGEIRQQQNRLTITLEASREPRFPALFSPALPPGARVQRVLVNGELVQYKVGAVPALGTESGESTYVTFRPHLSRSTTVEIDYEGGIGIVPVEPRPEPGDRTNTLKILRVEHNAKAKPEEIMLTVAGLGGRSYALDLITTVSSLTAEGATLQRTGDGYHLEISFEGTGYVTRQIRLRF